MGLDGAFGCDTMWVIPENNMNSGSEVEWTFLVGLSSKISPACVKLGSHQIVSNCNLIPAALARAMKWEVFISLQVTNFSRNHSR